MLQEGNEMRTRFLACYYFRPSDNQHSHKRVWPWTSKLSYVPKTWGYRNLICFPRRPCQVLAARFKNVKWCHRWVFLPSPTPLFSYFPHLPIPFFFLDNSLFLSQQYHVELENNAVPSWFAAGRNLFVPEAKGAVRKELVSGQLVCIPLWRRWTVFLWPSFPHGWGWGLSVLSTLLLYYFSLVLSLLVYFLSRAIVRFI